MRDLQQDEINKLKADVNYLLRLNVAGGVQPFVPWTDYSATLDATGWSSFTTKKFFYKRIGKLVFVAFELDGISNYTSTYFILPYNRPADGFSLQFQVRAYDNGAALTQGPWGRVASGGNTAIFRPAAGTGADASWTASGNKTVIGQFFYEAA